MLKKIDFYIIKKFLGTFFFAILIIISISVVFDFSEKIDEFMEKDAPFDAIIFDYYLNFIPYFANLFSYLFTFIAVIFFTSKMASQTEIIAILSSGVSFHRLMLPYFISALIIALFSFVLGSYIIPEANRVRLDFENTYVNNPYHHRERNIHRQISPGEMIYMESYNNSMDIGYRFSMEKFEDGKLVSKLMSQHCRWDSTAGKWTIHNYYIRHINGLEEELEIGRKLDTTLNLHPSDFGKRWNIYETMTNKQLNDFIKQQRLRGATNIEVYLIEKYRRYAAPFATFILTLIGVSLSSRKAKRGIGVHIGIGIAISFTYIMFMQVSSQFAISGLTSPFIAVWIPNIVFLIIGIFVYAKAPK